MIAWRWTGQGLADNVPARDLTAEDVAALTPAAWAAALALGLYEEVTHAGS